jgi:hypothetical protein
MKLITLVLAAWLLHAQNPNTAAFPTTVATDTTLAVAKRLSQSTLSTTINNSATSVVVADGTQFLTQEVIRIDNEEMQITAISTNTLTVTRGFNSTTAASHTAGATIQGVITSYHHNQMAAEMKSLEARLRETTSGCTDAGSNDTYACDLAPAISSYVTGSVYRFKANTANTGAATVNFNSLGAKTIKKHSSSGLTDLSDNDIVAGDWIYVVYNGTYMQIIGGVGSGGGTWGSITGTLSSQSDLNTALSAKLATATDQAGTPKYCRSTTGNDTYVCTLTPTLTAYTRGGCITLDGDTANTGTATVNVDSLGAKSILNRAGSALANADITANKPISLCYDGTQFIIQGDGGGGDATQAGDNTFTGDNNFSGKIRLPGTTTASLPSASTYSGRLYVVTDATAGAECTTGGSTLITLCRSDGSNWLPVVATFISSTTIARSCSGANCQYDLYPEKAVSQLYCASTSSSGTVYTCSVNAAYTSLTNGALLTWQVGGTSCTGSTSTTLNPSNGTSLGAKRIYRYDGTSNPLSSECPSGSKLLLMYDTSLTSGAGGWRILGGVPPGSGGSAGFDAITSGTNSGADMVVASGATFRANGATATAPNKSGTSLPGTCTVADTYVKTDATSAAQTYVCTATNTWTQQVGTGTGITMVSQVGDFAVTRTSSTVLTVGAGCNTTTLCRVKFGDQVYTFSVSATVTITSGSGTLYASISPAGALTFTSNLTLSGCSGMSCATTAGTGIPTNHIPIGYWTATSGTWDSSGGTDLRAFLGTKNVTGGTGISCADSSGLTTCGIDSTVPVFSAWTALTDGATISWNAASVNYASASVTLGGNRTLNVSNLVSGGVYTLRVTQDGTGSRTLTPGTGCTWKVSGGGAGAFSLSTTASRVDMISFVYDSGTTTCYVNIAQNFN